MKLLLDADILAYQSASIHEEAVEVEKDYWTWHCDIRKVKNQILETIEMHMDNLDGSEYILCLSDDKSNFRKSFYPQYKGNRSSLKRPVVLKPTRLWMIETLGARVTPGLEGDDLMGILATEDGIGNTIIISSDKDMKTIPGYFLKDGDLTQVSEQEADYYHLYQTLIGDQIDGYPGIKGIGPVAAKKILDKDPTWNAVVKAFEKAGQTEEDALTQARCARILRSSDFNPETQTPILWTPKE